MTDLGLSSIAVAAHTDLTTHEAVDELKRRIDFGNAFTYSKGKIDPALDYQEALPYACHLHLKDLNQEGDSWQFSQIGKGVITYDTILKKLAEEKKMLPLSIEHLFIYNASEDFIVNRLQRPPSLLHISTSLKRSIAYVQDVFKTYR